MDFFKSVHVLLSTPKPISIGQYTNSTAADADADAATAAGRGAAGRGAAGRGATGAGAADAGAADAGATRQQVQQGIGATASGQKRGRQDDSRDDNGDVGGNDGKRNRPPRSVSRHSRRKRGKGTTDDGD